VLTQASRGKAASLARSTGGAPLAWLSPPCDAPSGGFKGRLVPVSVAASSGTDLVVACGRDLAAGNALTQVFLSGNGGQTFSRLADPPVGGAVQLALLGTDTVLLTTGTALTRLAGGSATWTGTVALGGAGSVLSDVTFLDPEHGYLVVRPLQFSPANLTKEAQGEPMGRLFVSNNAGANWSPAAIPG
jgi:hypothetical protein